MHADPDHCAAVYVKSPVLAAIQGKSRRSCVRLTFDNYRGASCSVPVTGCVLTASADGIISRVS